MQSHQYIWKKRHRLLNTSLDIVHHHHRWVIEDPAVCGGGEGWGIREFMSCQKLSAIDGSTEADGLLSY